MKRGKYESLKTKYPEFVSLDQLCKICCIAKRSAKYLIENNIIPATDTGKKTWRYKIALEDVIAYMRKREQVGSMIPYGMSSSRTTKGARVKSTRKSFSQLVEPGKEREIAEYFTYIYEDYDSILTVADIVEMAGLEKGTVHKLLKAKVIKSLATYPRYVIPKQYFMEFVVTPKFINYRTNSAQLSKIIEGFELWKNLRN